MQYKHALISGLFSDATPEMTALATPPILNNLVTKFELSSPNIGGGGVSVEIPNSSYLDLTEKRSSIVPNFANTPAGKRLHKRLNDLMTTLRSSEDEINDSSSLLVKNHNISTGGGATDSLLFTTQPDFSGIDF